jgi:hypothetical protein
MIFVSRLELTEDDQEAIAYMRDIKGKATRNECKQVVDELWRDTLRKARQIYEPTRQLKLREKAEADKKAELKRADVRSERFSTLATEIGLQGEVVYGPDHRLYYVQNGKRVDIGTSSAKIEEKLTRLKSRRK